MRLETASPARRVGFLEKPVDVRQQPFLQGIIQAAVAFFHYQQGKWGAARTMMKQSIERLAPYPGSHGGIDLERFRSELRVWKQALDEAISRGSRAPLALDYPMINLRSE